jgi:thioredoxin-related protein
MVFICLIARITAADWLESYDEAIAKAQESDKPILAIVMRESCPYCQMLIHETLPNKAIDETITNNFVPLMLDIEKAPEQTARSRLNARAVPASFILNAQGAQIAVLVGYRSPMEFMRFLQQD